MTSTVEMMLSQAPKERRERSDLLRAGDIASALSLPPESFLQAAAYLKDQVVEATWKGGGVGQGVDPTAYSGLIGTAFLCLRSYEATGDRVDLLLAAAIVDACAAVAHGTKREHVFLCVYALGAVVVNCIGEPSLGSLLGPLPRILREWMTRRGIADHTQTKQYLLFFSSSTYHPSAT